MRIQLALKGNKNRIGCFLRSEWADVAYYFDGIILISNSKDNEYQDYKNQTYVSL